MVSIFVEIKHDKNVPMFLLWNYDIYFCIMRTLYPFFVVCDHNIFFWYYANMCIVVVHVCEHDIYVCSLPT